MKFIVKYFNFLYRLASTGPDLQHRFRSLHSCELHPQNQHHSDQFANLSRLRQNKDSPGQELKIKNQSNSLELNTTI